MTQIKLFSKESFSFLKNIKKNNNKEWFEKHKKDYETFLLEPLKTLVIALTEAIQTIDPEIEIRPAINKTISRIYRDVRFSKDKSPYKTSMWISFKRPLKNWQDFPAFFFEISADSYRYGMGFYCASRTKMDKLRSILDTKPDNFLQAISFLKKQKHFSLEGEDYKRTLYKKNLAEQLQPWYQKKSLYLTINKNIDEIIMSEKLYNTVEKDYFLLSPLYHFLANL